MIFAILTAFMFRLEISNIFCFTKQDSREHAKNKIGTFAAKIRTKSEGIVSTGNTMYTYLQLMGTLCFYRLVL